MEANIIEEQGIVERLNEITVSSMKMNDQLSEAKRRLEESDIYQEVKRLELLLSELKKAETHTKDLGKHILLEKGIKKFEALDGTVVQLNKLPGKLIIKDEGSKELDEYRKEKISISLDKKQIKEDLKEGVIINGVYIEDDYKLVVKSI